MIDKERIYKITGSQFTQIDTKLVTNAVTDLLIGIGENLERDDLQKTPSRTAQMLEEILSGYYTDPMAIVEGAAIPDDGDQLVIVRDIVFYSMCEHHLLPFMGKVQIAYLPGGSIIGLSRFSKIVDLFAHRLQLQERLTKQIADFVDLLIKPKGVAVFIDGFHLCASMRGVKQQDLRLHTASTLGCFKDDPNLRQQVVQSIYRQV